ncbi:MAG: hypothetical protein JXA46_19950 [Dehalococcoidales bacterium]|nr:hypothetical protein [Dehalococcoidales bacterium]
MHNPQVLVLDEPEAGLDFQSRVLVREYVHGWAKAGERTVVLTTHNMDEADRMADRVAIIDHGSVLVLDTPVNLKRSIGTGDVLKINVVENNEQAQKAYQITRMIIENVSLRNGVLIIKTLNVIDLLPLIIVKLRENNIKYEEIRLHTNTLEDVFIALTGRRLRE